MPDFDPRTPSALAAALLVALFAGAGAGAATTWLIRPAAEPLLAGAPAPEGAPEERQAPAIVESSVDADELLSLRAELERAEAERSQLAGTVLALNRRSETIEARLTLLASERESARGLSVDTVPDEAEAMLPSGEVGDVLIGGEAGGGDQDQDLPRDRRLDERESLLAAGLDPQSIDELARRRDGFELERLQLIDRASREGWRDSERFDREIETLEENRPDLREELGDEAYDRYLYEQGGGNRVGVASVMSGSVAEQAGLQSGDVIVSYAGERVFRLRDLQSATRAGSYGEPVQLSVRRDGEVVAVEVVRGPLGVSLSPTRREPD